MAGPSAFIHPSHADAPAPAEPATRVPANQPRRAASDAAWTSPLALRVLVVDDEVDIVDSMALLLRLAGHDPVIASDGLAALEVARSAQPQVAVLDLGLPGIDGFELGRRLLAEPWARENELLLVAASGWASAVDRDRTRAIGFHRHLAKPVSPEVLVAAIDAHARRLAVREKLAAVATLHP